MIAAAIRIIFAQPRPEMVHDQLDAIAGMLGRQSTKWRPCSVTSPPLQAPVKPELITA